ncbi:MAG: DUF2071 domain-containing protein [Actinobacteria bacterium]|nr:DUF2071 domain-containing protein [Actinomycetota bacterium]
MAQTWEQLLFAHWRVPIERLREHLPELEVDTHSGEAWLGVTPFRVTNLRFRGMPPLPRLSSFLELNCRTYVSHAGEKPGIWFFSLDASSRLAVEAARRLYKLPYFQARIEGPPRYSCSRIGAERPHVWESSHRPAGTVAPGAPGTLEHFLTERYCLYTVDEAGALHRAEIHHLPWPLQPAEAEIDLNTMPPDGLETSGEPHLHYSERQDVLIWPLEPCPVESSSRD